ncbi:putative serine acetyltransferase 2 [Drosera capensis]
MNSEDKRVEGKDNGERANGVLSSRSLNKIFPVYALGFERRGGEGDESDDGGDPIWRVIKEEAKLEADEESILNDFLYSSILSHDCLEHALAFVLSNRLQNTTLLGTLLMDIFCNVMNDKNIQRAVRLDVQAFKDRDPACLSFCWVLLYLKVFGVDIHPAARIGAEILLDHATGVVIGETAVLGNRVSLMQGVTLGGTGKEVGDRHPKVGDGALIGAGATILGNIKIGEGAMVAAGSLVLKDVPPHSVVAGIPAKVIGYAGKQDPSLTMKQDAPVEFYEQDTITSAESGSTGKLSYFFSAVFGFG